MPDDKDPADKSTETTIPTARFNELNQWYKDAQAERDSLVAERAETQAKLELYEQKEREAAEAEKTTDQPELDPALKGYVDQEVGRVASEAEQNAAVEWIQNRPESIDDNDYQQRISKVIKDTARRYGYDPRINPRGFFKVVYDRYKQAKATLDAETKKAEGTGKKDAGEGSGERKFGKEAITPLTGGAGGDKGAIKYTLDQVSDPKFYKANRDKILAANREGQVG